MSVRTATTLCLHIRPGHIDIWPGELSEPLAERLAVCGFHHTHFVSALYGVPLLQTKKGVGYLAASATIPTYRRRGVQSVLIRHRMGFAADQNCKIVCSEAEFGSVSQRNLERAGMRVACTYANWQRVRPHDAFMDG
jgi:GNAT superfamily N-acetyltransferase